MRIYILQVEDQLCQVFDGINVVMGRGEINEMPGME